MAIYTINHAIMSIHGSKRCMLYQTLRYVAHKILRFGGVKLHDRSTGAQVTLLKIDIKYTQVGDYIKIIKPVTDVAERAPLRR